MAAWSDPLSMPSVPGALGLRAPSGRNEALSWFAPGISGNKLFGGGSEAYLEDPNLKPGDFMGLNPRSSNFAQQAFAAITRQQWDDYLTNYVPIENRLIDYAMDETLPQEAAALAGRDVEQAFGRQRATTERRLAGMGLQLTPEEQSAADKQSRLSESLASVGAMNNARDATSQRQQSVLGNPSPRLPQGGF